MHLRSAVLFCLSCAVCDGCLNDLKQFIPKITGFHVGTVNFSPQIGIFYYYGSTESPAGNPSQAPTPVREPEAVSLAPETSQVKLVYRSAIPMDGQVNKVAAILTKEALDSSVTSWDCHICDGLKKQFGVPFECVFESQFSALIGKCRRKCSIFELKKRGSIFFLMVKIGSVQT
ncbi:hypothetical protein HDE_13860 [Halotydeus destructor]|nr:hypothetical protein HDE_13860 [Halotydeus destructor]